MSTTLNVTTPLVAVYHATNGLLAHLASLEVTPQNVFEITELNDKERKAFLTYLQLTFGYEIQDYYSALYQPGSLNDFSKAFKNYLPEGYTFKTIVNILKNLGRVYIAGSGYFLFDVTPLDLDSFMQGLASTLPPEGFISAMSVMLFHADQLKDMVVGQVAEQEALALELEKLRKEAADAQDLNWA